MVAVAILLPANGYWTVPKNLLINTFEVLHHPRNVFTVASPIDGGSARVFMLVFVDRHSF